ncbi:MAG: cellulose binding domain-containing protein, partial [Pseudomonadota bacterium]
MTDEATAAALFDGSVRNAWNGGGIIDMHVRAHEAIADWSVEVNLGGAIVNIWNAVVLARTGNTYTLGPLDYNKAVSAGGSADFGVEIKGDARFDPRHATVVEAGVTPGVEAAPPLSPPPLDAAEAGAPPADVALPSTPSAAPASPQQSTSAAPSGVATNAPIDGPLSTSGRAIMDETGQPVDIYGVNWFGFETDVYT